MPSSRGSSQPRDRTCISYVSFIWAGEFFTTSATWETNKSNCSDAEPIIQTTLLLEVSGYTVLEFRGVTAPGEDEQVLVLCYSNFSTNE